MVKLQSLLQEHPELAKCVFAAALDGDTPHSQRALIAETCNVVFTNPDTLHASILPHWETKYRTLLQNLKYVVIDEAHTYEGVFGAHVAMILARLYRVHCCCCKNNIHDNDDSDSDRDSDNDNDKEQYAQDNRPKPTIIDGNDATTSRGNNNNNSNSALNPPPSSSTSTSASLVFLACSATLAYPEHHFRLLCCIPSAQPVTVLTDDFSPRAAKHFFVWNPPLLDENGKSLGYVAWPNKAKAKTYSKQKGASTGKKRKSSSSSSAQKDPTKSTSTRGDNGKQPNDGSVIQLSSQSSEIEKSNIQRSRKEVRRRHSADETALLLARAVTKGVRCIAFCKTRCLVEWVYERCIRALKQSPETAKLISKVDSYRGGYSRLKRREIEEKLFHNQLLGVVGTSALELGVDIGGVGLTLHCGFPSSHASLMQQAGRAGRGAAASHQPSLAICVCFNSPIDQHLWRHPTSLLSRGLSAPLSMPIYPGLVQGHLICAGNEFPLTGRFNTSAIQTVEEKPVDDLLSDEELFGSKKVYLEAMESLMSNGSFSMEKIAVFGGKFIAVFKTHPSIKNPWTEVSIRSIETVNYDIVDLSHPMQGNRMDGKHHEAAIMDNIPYSRVFYHAFPGAIITHRGRRYKIVSMTRPPAFGVGFRSTVTLGAYAKPSSHRYCTRPLSNLKITVVKQMERVDLTDKGTSQKELNQAPPDPSTIFSDDLDPSLGSFAGCGIITVKRNVHGYKKISLVTRDELSRSELSLPDMEYDTFAFWIDCDASGLGRLMTQQAFGYGVHALSHALCNVAPLFVPCVLNDVQCDHSFYSPTRVVIFDSRAGGSGITAQLWKSIFTPRGLVQAAVDLLQTCPSCADDAGYTGGCPACIQAGECIKFNDFLCKSSALIIARHMLQRLEKTELYKQKVKEQLNEEFGDGVHSQLDSNVSRDELKKKKERDSFSSPRSEKRRKAMRVAMDIDTARQRQLVIGRPSWPMDRSSGTPREQQEA
uniref:Helicase C-terminal domain-containing protein n=1 Tax=Pseudo-nitzschia australis TaxID=44445 RepID=A0A7S4AD27_9STRA